MAHAGSGDSWVGTMPVGVTNTISRRCRTGALNAVGQIGRPGLWSLLLLTCALVLGLPQVALAGPREDAKDAYAEAMRQFYDLELDAAVATVDDALRQAKTAGISTDPALAPLLLLRGGLTYANTHDRSSTIAAFREALEADYHVSLPVELGSPELELLLEEARAMVPKPRPDDPAPLPHPEVQAPVIALEAPLTPVEAEQSRPPARRRAGPLAWPRLYVNVGVGTGVGLAHGEAEQSYEQYVPGVNYGSEEQACAIARWYAGNGPLAAGPDELAALVDPTVLPGGDPGILQDNYDPEACGRRQGLDPGIASAPLHLTPELMVRLLDRDIGERRSLALLAGAFGRLQVITGSRFFTNERDETPLLTLDDARSIAPAGVQRKPAFTWAVGGKLQALITRRDGRRRLHGMIGIFGGYGRSRLRVDLDFSNDRNGNSVPDRREAASSDSSEGCVAVFPYNAGCRSDTQSRVQAKDADTVRRVESSDRRIDTVALGPAFAGVLVGFRYQPLEHFGIYGEVDIGAWFPDVGSLLVDVNVGPSITF